jgi:hypothetical protein
VDVEIVWTRHDDFGMREVEIGQILQDVGIVHGGMAIRDLR